MKVTNYHFRVYNHPKAAISIFFNTLTTKNDMIWPIENWPAMRFKDGLVVGSKGGHGPIRYTIIDYHIGESIKFRFTNPIGFNGTHILEIIPLSENKTKIQHTIQMETSFIAHLKWIIVICPIHDALVEEAFDIVNNRLNQDKIISTYTVWVKLLRKLFSPKKSS